MTADEISVLIDTSPMNRGMVGAEWTANPDNIAVVTASGNVMLFEYRPGGVYEFHWLSTSQSGKRLVDDTREAMRKVFRQGAVTIYGMIPAEHRSSRVMAHAIGAQSQGKFSTDNGPVVLFVILPENLERLH